MQLHLKIKDFLLRNYVQIIFLMRVIIKKIRKL